MRVRNGSGQVAPEQNLSCDYTLTQHLGKKQDWEVSDTFWRGSSPRCLPALPPAPVQGTGLAFPRYCIASIYRCSNPMVFLFFFICSSALAFIFKKHEAWVLWDAGDLCSCLRKEGLAGKEHFNLN